MKVYHASLFLFLFNVIVQLQSYAELSLISILDPQFHRANNVDLDAVSIHGDDELDDIDKEIKGLSEGAAENSKKTNSKGMDL